MSKGVIHIPNEAEAWPHVEAWSRMDEIAVVFDCPHTTPTLTDHGPYVVRSQDIRGRRFDMSSAGRVSEGTYVERISRAEPKYGDLLYSREGTYFGISAPVPRGERVCLGQRMTLLRPDPEQVDHIYLNYWLNSDLMERFLAGFRDGSVAQRLNMSTIRGLPVPILLISEQRHIARTLQALDDKIELNRRISATLEEMARALYRSWFVDFDPVHARALGQPPAHMDATTATLFPDSFGPDGLPKGWHAGTLGDLIEFNPKERLPKGTAAPYLDMKALPTSGMSADAPYLRDFISGTKFRERDTLLARITPCLENGKTAVVDDLLGAKVGWGSTEFIVMRAKAGISPGLPYCIARDADFRAEAIQTMTGSSGRQRADAKRIAELSAAVAPPAVHAAFSDLIAPMFDRITAAGKEARNLAALRDTLLPRLMSGELRVHEAEKQVEEVA